MGSKAFILLGFLAAIAVLLFTSEVAARDLAETMSADKKDGEFFLGFILQQDPCSYR